MTTDFDKLARLAAPLPGSTSSLYPPVYLRTVIHLEEKLANQTTGKDKETGNKKKMNANAARALTAIKAKIKKAARDNEAVIKEYTQVGLDGSNELAFQRAETSFNLRRIMRHTRGNTKASCQCLRPKGGDPQGYVALMTSCM